MVLGQYRTVLVGTGSVLPLLGGTGWFWISIGRHWLVLGGTGSLKGMLGGTTFYFGELNCCMIYNFLL